jgi:pullulanase/glycogen debranching enzyme
MMQRWLLDQMRHFIDEFGVDGFRIDLAGATDEQSLRYVRDRLPADVIIYGEPWIPPSDPDVIANPDWAWYKADAPIVYFQDASRNAVKGPVSTPRDPATDRGFAGGDGAQRETVMQGLAATLPDERSPLDGISYLDIHDNWALADQFARHTEGPNAWDGRAGVDEAAVRIAATLLFTTPGPLVLHGGTEILRSKGLAPHPDALGGERVVRTAMGPIYLKGRGDTYNLRAANRFDWETVGRADGPVGYAAMMDWWRGLIELRRSPLGQTFRRAERPVLGEDLTFVLPENGHAEGLGYVARGAGAPDLLVLLNPGSTDALFRIPVGPWTTLAASDRDGGRMDLTNGLGRLAPGGPGETRVVRVPPQGIRIARRGA